MQELLKMDLKREDINKWGEDPPSSKFLYPPPGIDPTEYIYLISINVYVDLVMSVGLSISLYRVRYKKIQKVKRHNF